MTAAELNRQRRLGASVAEKVAADHGFTMRRLRMHTRGRAASEARTAAMRAVRTQTSLSLPEIGRLFRRDHTTVHHAVTPPKEAPPRPIAEILDELVKVLSS